MLLANKDKMQFFDGMNDADIALIIKSVDFKSFLKGDTIIKEDECAETIYVILSGECNAIVSDIVVGKLYSNSIIGEVSGMSTGFRQATVVATKDLQVIELVIDYDKFDKYIVPFSYFYRNISLSLSQKITNSNAKR